VPSRRPPRTSRAGAYAALALALVLLAGCASGDGGPPGPDGTGAPERGTAATASPPARPGAEPDASPAVTIQATELQVPWGLAISANGRVFFTERDTGVVSELSQGRPRPVRGIDGVVPGGEGGLLGIALSPEFADDRLVYAYFTGAEDNRVVRFALDRPDPVQVLVRGIPKAGVHNGGRIAFGPDGMLYVGTGDAGRSELAQSRGSLAGKILRVRPDGSVPPDNPFPGSPVWSLGHRNVQGLAWDGRGRMWAAELGPDRDDEVNQIVRGGNYGWPQVTGATRADGFRPALAVKQPSEASWSGLAFVAGEAFPEWGDSLVASGLRGGRLWRFPITPEGGLGPGEELFGGEFGRLRAVVSAPDGALWFTTSNRDGRGEPAAEDDRILRYGR